MAYISDIIDAIEKKYQIKVKGKARNHSFVDGIRFFNEDDANIEHLLPDILYIADFKTFGQSNVYGYVIFIGSGGEVPASDSLYTEEELSLTELYNLMEDVILSYRQIEVQKRNLFNILHSGLGMRALLETAYKYLNNVIVICDSSYAILEAYPEVPQTGNLEIRNNRLSVDTKSSEDMEQKKVTERIYHSVYPFATRFDDFSYHWIFESIRIKRAVVGYICVICSQRDYVESDLDLIHTLTQMVSIQLQKDDSYRNPQGIKYDNYLKDLFGRHLSEDNALTQLKLLGVKPMNYYYIIASSFTNSSERLLTFYYYIQQLSAILPNSISGIFGNRFITLVSTDKMETLQDNTLSRLKTFLTMNNMISAVSYLFDRLSDSSAYYNQCQSLLTQSLTVFNESPVVFYQDYYLKHVLNMLSNLPLAEASVHPAIKFTKKYDEEHGTNYIETLQSYFENNRSAAATANALFIHKSTLFYRFDRMKQLFNISLDDNDALFAYEYSIKILSFIASSKSPG